MNKIRKRHLFEQISYILRGEWSDIGVITVYAVGVGVCSLSVPIAVQSLVSNVAFGSLMQPVVVLTLLLGGVLSFSGVMRILQLWTAELLQRRIITRGTLGIAQRLPHVDIAEFSKKYGADYIVRFMELFEMQKILTLILLDGTSVLFQIIIGLVIVSFYHPFFLVFALLLMVAISVIVFFLSVNGISSVIAESDAKYSIITWLQALARHPEIFKSQPGYAFSVETADQLTEEYLNCRSKHFAVLMRQNIAAMLLQAVSSAVLLGVGGWLVIKGQLTLGQLVAAELIFSLVLVSVTKLGKHLEKFYDLAASTEKLDSLFNLPYENPVGNYFGIDENPAHLNVINVTVNNPLYPTPLFKDITFELMPGDKAVILGGENSGKSILANLLFRFDKYTSGRIEIDGHPINEIHPMELRSEVALVKGIGLFRGTVEDNILLGRKDRNNLDVKKVLKMVGLEDDIYSLPDSLKTIITSDEFPFSTGQSLRLMIARALISAPRLLIVDGTLDAMDKDSQSLISDMLRQHAPGITMLILTNEPVVAEKFEKKYKLEDQVLTEF